MRKHIVLLSGICLASASALAGDYSKSETDPADASTKHQVQVVGFDVLDTDGDKKISKSEAKDHAFLSSSFAKADTDSDGYLSRAEFDSLDTGS